MRLNLFLCIPLSLLSSSLCTQTLPSSRATTWTKAGAEECMQSIFEINMLDMGADKTGSTSSNSAFDEAIAQLDGGAGVLYFPPGIYFFDETLVLKDSLVIKGAGSDQTVLNFDLGGSGDLISCIGSWSGEPDSLVESAFVGDSIVVVDDGSLWQVGDLARLHKNDADLVNDSWALFSVAQIVLVREIVNDTLFLDQQLRTDFPIDRFPALRKILPIHSVGVECLKINRLDETSTQSKNIYFRRSTECWVRGVESNNCNFGHVVIDQSSHVTVSGSYFHHGFNYGGGGKAYGVVLHGSASLCKVENNVFEHLRHSILLQSGANGNVISFNFSTDPFWSLFPSNSAGDLVCHGNYPFFNLFEHNIVQNIVIDNSHDANGPYNTFFRNRAELYGIIMSANNSPNQNFLGNEITGSGLGLGNYTLMGAGHFEYGNNDNGTIIPSGTGDLTDDTYFYFETPHFTDQMLPVIGTPNDLNENSIPARDRFLDGGTVTMCPDICEVNYFSWNVWTGCGENTNWDDPENWSQQKIPGDTDAVLIPASVNGNYYPLVQENTAINILCVVEGGRLEVIEGILFTVLSDQ